MATIYSRVRNQYNFNYQTVFLAGLDTQEKDGHVLDEIDI